MRKRILAVAVCIISLVGSFVFAETPVVNAKERKQERRINQGVKSGKISRSEARHLRGNVRDIKKEKRAMIEANGGKPLTAEQRQSLRHSLNQNSKEIYQEKHEGAQPPVQPQ